MHRSMVLALPVSVLVLAVSVLATPAAGQQLEMKGQLRPRFEIRDPAPGLTPDAEGTAEFTSMRSRVSLAVGLPRSVDVFFQLQDVRIWGGETGTMDGSADALDLHQGWLELGDPEADRVAVRIGRQELAYGGERLIGAVDWAQQGRSFDGIRVRVRPTDALEVDGVLTRIGDVDAGRPDASLVGVYGSWETAGRLDGYVLYHSRDRLVEDPAPASEDLSKTYTLGARWSATTYGIDWRVEAAYQVGEDRETTGTTAANDVTAALFAVRAGTRPTEALGVTLWYDFLSGDGDPTDDDTRVFDTLFATNHKFYGHMDLFVDIPADTDGRGLQDLAIKTTYDLAPGHRLGADLHTFLFTETEGLDNGHIGEELDLTYRWAYAPGLSLTAGASYLFAGDAAGELNVPAADGVAWGFVMIGVVF